MTTTYGLSISEVAAWLGVPPETARSMHRRGQLPPPDVVIGEGTRRPVHGWSRATLDAWMQARAKQPATRARRGHSTRD